MAAAWVVLPLGMLVACAPPPSASKQAELAACTQSADAVYQQDNLNQLGRTGQNGLYFAPMPNRVFDGQVTGSLNARANQIRDCMTRGTPNAPARDASLPAPQISGTAQ